MANTGNNVIVAVAGAGKTEEVTRLILNEDGKKRICFLTYTRRNQREEADRLAAKTTSLGNVDVMGWIAFLLNEIVRPYIRVLFCDVKIEGLTKRRPPEYVQRATGVERFITSTGNVWAEHLPQLAVKVIEASKDAPIRRLESIYDSIYIDEAQDLCGNDYVVIEHLLRSNIKVCLVADPRQSSITTSTLDKKYKNKIGVNLLALYRDYERRGICSLRSMNKTHRCSQVLATFSDSLFPPLMGFEKTVSALTERNEHEGLYLISKKQIEEYASFYSAIVLRWNKRAKVGNVPEVANFGECKGMTRNHVVVVSTKPIQQFLMEAKYLEVNSMCKFYVASTRAKHSLAIAVDDPEATLDKLRMAHPEWLDEGIEFSVWEKLK